MSIFYAETQRGNRLDFLGSVGSALSAPRARPQCSLVRCNQPRFASSRFVKGPRKSRQRPGVRWLDTAFGTSPAILSRSAPERSPMLRKARTLGGYRVLGQRPSEVIRAVGPTQYSKQAAYAPSGMLVGVLVPRLQPGNALSPEAPASCWRGAGITPQPRGRKYTPVLRLRMQGTGGWSLQDVGIPRLDPGNERVFVCGHALNLMAVGRSLGYFVAGPLALKFGMQHRVQA